MFSARPEAGRKSLNTLPLRMYKASNEFEVVAMPRLYGRFLTLKVSLCPRERFILYSIQGVVLDTRSRS